MAATGFDANEFAFSRRNRRHLRWIAARTAPARTLALHGKRRLLIFGDLHLDAHNPRAWQPFRTFLDRIEPAHTAALVCLGDLFEYYLGAAHVRGPLGEALDRLARLVERGVPVFVVPGNRDFLIGREFRRRGIEVCTHGLRLDLCGSTAEQAAATAALWIVHGDELMLNSALHRKWSKLSRTRFARLATGAMPVPLLDWAARRMREQSRRRRRRHATADSPPLPRVDPNVCASLHGSMMAASQASTTQRWLVTGHFHVPLIEHCAQGSLLTVGEWDDLGGVIGSFCTEGASNTVTGRLLHSREVVEFNR